MERRKRRKEKRELGSGINLYLCFCFQTDLAVCYFHGVLHGVAAILFADLLGLPLNKGLEATEAGVSRYAALPTSFRDCFKQRLDCVLFVGGVGAGDCERLVCFFLISSFQGRGSRLFLFVAKSGDTQHGIGWTPIPLFFHLHLLPPKIAEDGISLGNGVESKTLGVIELQGLTDPLHAIGHPPLGIYGRFL